MPITKAKFAPELLILLPWLEAQESVDSNSVQIEETHISWVILSRDFAYKIKKPVKLNFLDFSTLEQRKYFCDEEFRLNKRFAKNLYLGVVCLRDTTNKPIEYAVKMRRFRRDQRWDVMLDNKLLTLNHIKNLAFQLAGWPDKLPRATMTSPYGNPATVYRPVQETLQELSTDTASIHCDTIEMLSTWCQSEYQNIVSPLLRRKRAAKILECHGDLHLRNIIWSENDAVPFDCLEFDEFLRWIDIICEISFTLMDLDHSGHQQLSNVLLNKYLEYSNDFDGLSVLKFYSVYRALVRAKVNRLRASQTKENHSQSSATKNIYSSYLALAKHYTMRGNVRLFITHGISGTGKSTVCEQLNKQTGILYVKSDAIRKHLFSEDSLQTSQHLTTNLYCPHKTKEVYQSLLSITEGILTNGYSAIVDATFLNQEYRGWFRSLARKLNISFNIVHLKSDPALLRQRIEARKTDKENISDATQQVLEDQLKQYSGLNHNEKSDEIMIDTDSPIEPKQLAKELGLSVTNEKSY